MLGRPTGTVTFLFTDIEGSTVLWERQPEAMRPALARHDILLREAIERHGGHVFKTVGDAFCAAFTTAPDALAAALDAQRALAAEPWPAGVSVRVRMALHTGAAEERDGDYFGPPLNRVARLLSAGYGGQTLLSHVMCGLALDGLPDGAALRDLGECRLRDLGRPERVFQLLHPSLPADFPPLRSLDSPELPNNLPPQNTSFIGREKEAGEVAALLGGHRLVTLTGAGGAGKSRLSLQVAADVLDQYPDGAWFVELAPLSDPALVPRAVAVALGVREQPGQTLLQTLAGALSAQALLLVLDNCEHLLAACAALADALLRACPRVRILASSREPLGVAGEQTYRVPSLSLPDPRHAQTPQALSQYEAVALFIERARLVRPDFAVSDANAPAVAQVCWRLDGIPLAIELAAARVRAMPVEQVSARLDDRFRLLTGGSRTALPRQQTLRALIDWSYDLLSQPEKTLLRRLSVFAGGWTLEAAERVCAGEDIEEWEVLDLLTGLVDKSLVVYEEKGDGQAGAEGRYRLLETVRQYSAERLRESGEAEALRGRHRDFFLALAEDNRPRVAMQFEPSWQAWMRAEHDNMRAALDWCLAEPAGAQPGLRLAAALSYFWDADNLWSEGRERLAAALARPGAEERTEARADALRRIANMALWQGDHGPARSLLEEALAISRERGDRRGEAIALILIGWFAWEEGNYARARALGEQVLPAVRAGDDRALTAHVLYFLGRAALEDGDHAAARTWQEESVRLFRELGHPSREAWGLVCVGQVAEAEGDLTAAEALFERARALSHQHGCSVEESVSLGHLGRLAGRRGDLAASISLLEQALRIAREIQDRRIQGFMLNGLGRVLTGLGEYEEAGRRLREALTVRRQLGHKPTLLTSLATTASLAARQGQWARAARLYGASQSLRGRLGVSMKPAIEGDPADLGAQMARAEEALGAEAFAAAWAEGEAMTLEEAVEYALSGLPPEDDAGRIYGR